MSDIGDYLQVLRQLRVTLPQRLQDLDGVRLVDTILLYASQYLAASDTSYTDHVRRHIRHMGI